MWILFAVGSAFFAGATSVLAKAGIKSVSSDFATAFRTGVVPIDKCSMLFAVALSAVFLKEKQTRRSLLALTLVVAGTLLIVFA